MPKKAQYFVVVICFGAPYGSAQGLTIPLHLGITAGEAQGENWGAREQPKMAMCK